MSTKFQVTLRCQACQHKYKRVMEADDEDSLDDIPDPPCPVCSKAARKPRGLDVSKGKAPGIGGNLAVKATDYTMNMVAQDYGMTDLRTDAREGEAMAPKLPPRQQAMADNMFAKRGGRGVNPASIMGLDPRQVMRAAVGGRFNTPDTPNPVALQHKRRASAPVNIIAGDGVTPVRR